ERPRTEMWWALFEGPSKLRSKLERTERKALARPKPRHVVPLVPDAPLGDDLMRPLPEPRSRVVPIAVGSLLAVSSVALVVAVWEAKTSDDAPLAALPPSPAPSAVPAGVPPTSEAVASP